MYEAVFHVTGDSPFERATGGTDTTIELWCNNHCDLLQVSGTKSDRVIEDVRASVGIAQQVKESSEHVLITDDCLKERIEHNVEKFLPKHGCLLMPPLKYAFGEKRVRVLALNEDALSSFYQDLSGEFPVTVETKQSTRSVTPESPFLAVDALLPDLSPRQQTVFMIAHREGYYELPREITTEEIASKVGIERRTAEDHLRRAERKLVESMVEYL